MGESNYPLYRTVGALMAGLRFVRAQLSKSKRCRAELLCNNASSLSILHLAITHSTVAKSQWLLKWCQSWVSRQDNPTDKSRSLMI